MEYCESALQIASCSQSELQCAVCQMNGKMTIFIHCTITKSLTEGEESLKIFKLIFQVAEYEFNKKHVTLVH